MASDGACDHVSVSQHFTANTWRCDDCGAEWANWGEWLTGSDPAKAPEACPEEPHTDE